MNLCEAIEEAKSSFQAFRRACWLDKSRRVCIGTDKGMGTTLFVEGECEDDGQEYRVSSNCLIGHDWEVVPRLHSEEEQLKRLIVIIKLISDGCQMYHYEGVHFDNAADLAKAVVKKERLS